MHRQKSLDDIFFKAIENGHGVVTAARMAGYTHPSAYRWRKEDPAFDARWVAAEELHIESLEREADRRGKDGWEEEVYQGGELVGTKRKYSDALLQFRLRGLRPDKYADRQKTDINASIVADQKTMADMTIEEVEEYLKKQNDK